MDKIKWGILGYARIAKGSVIPAILKTPNSELYAIASANEKRLEEARSEFQCSKYYSSYTALLDDPEVQAVYIPLPNSLHKEWTIKAARKGKHVLCEKSMGLNAGECIEMADECKKHGVKLMEAFMYRYSTRTQKVKELLGSGVIGEVRHISSTFGIPLQDDKDVRFDPRLGGGALYDVGCYPVNFAGMVTGDAPISVSSQYVSRHGVDVMLSAVLKYESGIICSISCWFGAFLNAHSEITGTKGILKIPNTFDDRPEPITAITSQGSEKIEIEIKDRYALQIEDFADAVINDRSPLFSVDETIRNIRIIEQLLKR
ncbi:putative dehydrogenase [Anaerobacterium chartisolvens]|uniref:Putative dehydrogenase n=1 Tax=Anaerobacterium chartisolvens TaxID=1297424 RepID=A0A369BKI7_9FIRM|nr:Gfo/Idh/MocA family oxidoreductase [Anaerobacterium chartisolvens]RCX20204.1 putative dehydrogenase [Anaerobacterium chartisolvens]